jgi:hypothetical protein
MGERMTRDDDNVLLIQAVLDKIRAEMARLYWNKCHSEIHSPFDNTGVDFVCDTFEVHAYDWQGVGNVPNFKYPGIEVYWYKHSNRGVVVYTETLLTVDYLTKMLNDCYKAMKDFFEK